MRKGIRRPGIRLTPVAVDTMKRVQGLPFVDRLTSAARLRRAAADAASSSGSPQGDRAAMAELYDRHVRRRLLSRLPDRELAGRCGRRRAGSLHAGLAAGGPLRRGPGLGGRLAAEHRPGPARSTGCARTAHGSVSSADRRPDRSAQTRRRIRSSRRSGASAPSASARRSHRAGCRRSARRSTSPTSAG